MCPFSSRRTSSWDAFNKQDCFSQEPLSPFEARDVFTPEAPYKKVTAARFSRVKSNKYMHIVNGNITYFQRRNPPPNTYLWAQSFYIPNGMCIFKYSFMVKIQCGFMPHEEDLALSWKLLGGNLPLCTGQSVERWPPEEAGRETAGNMSRAMTECGDKGRGPKTLTLANTYVMMCQAATNTVKLTGATLKEDIAPCQHTGALPILEILQSPRKKRF